MHRDLSYDYLVKLIVIGDTGVGKTNMMTKFIDNNFHASHLTTIGNTHTNLGIDFKIKTLNINNSKVRMQIWDTAGQERFKTITQTYYKGAMGIFLVYSVSERESFQNVETWLKQIKLHASENVVKVLVGNKCDVENRQVSEE